MPMIVLHGPVVAHHGDDIYRGEVFPQLREKFETDGAEGMILTPRVADVKTHMSARLQHPMHLSDDQLHRFVVATAIRVQLAYALR